MTFYKFWNDQGLVLPIFQSSGTETVNYVCFACFSSVFIPFALLTPKNTIWRYFQYFEAYECFQIFCSLNVNEMMSI